MHIASDYNEDLIHTYWVYRSKDCTDCSYCFDSELLYECTDCEKCYNCQFCQDCKDSFDLQHCYDCIGCRNCIGCVGLRRQEYMIFNKKVTQEEFEQFQPENIQENLEKLQKETPRLYSHTLHNEDSTGDYIYHVKNCHQCWDSNYAQDCIYIDGGVSGLKDCVDCSFFMDNEFCYECVSTAGFNLNFCNIAWDCSDCEFCELCFNCHNCFGCIGLKAKKFHILNEPYAEEQYFKKVEEIKQELRKSGKYNLDVIKSVYPINDSCIEDHQGGRRPAPNINKSFCGAEHK